MKKSYRNQKHGGNFYIFTMLGIGCAFIFAIGAMKQAGFRLVKAEESSAVRTEKIAAASLGGMPISSTDQSADHAAEIVVLTAPSAVEAPKTIHPTTSSESPSNTRLFVEGWINQFDEAATVQALDRGVPAGIALAYGITQINKGVSITNWNEFNDQVIEPLVRIKTNASSAARSKYFRYSANSGLWAEGLENQGKGNANALKKLIAQHQLIHYDSEVKKRLKGATSNDPEIEKKAEAIAKKVSNTQAQKTTKTSADATKPEKVAQWKSNYDAEVGQSVAKEIAKKKLSSGKYITEEDMNQLLEETNQETAVALENKIMFMGRKINQNHPDAAKLSDKTNPQNAQARGEHYQERLQAKRKAGN